MNLLYQLVLDFSGLLFPNLCCGCRQPLFKGETQICSSCLFQLPYTDHHEHAANKAAKQLWGRLPCLAVMSLCYFRKGARVQNLVHHLKYKGRQDLGLKLGGLIAEKIKLNPDYAAADLIIPVPLHPARARTRGYNQSLCIANGISAVLNIPVQSNLLIRKVNTSSQTKKGRFTRFENMQTVFSVSNQTALQGKHILLVDDVITTGATLEACGLELFKQGIQKLSIATIAFAE